MPGEWHGTGAAYDASFARLCAGAVEPLLDAVGSLSGADAVDAMDAADAGASAHPSLSLLDVGTGPGTLARAAAVRGYRVTACDPEPSMIETARAHAALSRHPAHIHYSVAGLPDLPFAERSFDIVCANFVVNHTPSPRAATTELARVARQAVAVTIWPRMRTVLNGLWSGVVRDAEATTPPGILLPPDEDFERTECGLAALLDAAGLRPSIVSTLEWDFAIAADDLWLAVDAGVATIGTTYRAQDKSGRRRMRDAYTQRTRELVGHDGLLHFPTYALLGVATR